MLFRKKKKSKWFVKVRGSYLPNSWQGWLSFVPFTAYCVWALAYAFQPQFHFMESVMIVVPQWVAAAVIMTWVASNRS